MLWIFKNKYISNFYKSYTTLNSGLRSMLVDIIANHLIKNNIKMTCCLADEIADKIIEVFPNESKVLYYYKSKGKAPKGKIYEKYFNKLRKLRKVGVLPAKQQQAELEEPANTSRAVQEDDCEESISALAADNCSWAEIEHHWLKTNKVRTTFINSGATMEDIFRRWPQYKKPLGYKLIEMDFKKLNPNVPSIISSFPEFLVKIIPMLEEKVKGTKDQNLLSVLKCNENFNENGQAASLFHLIHHILLPTAREVRVENNKKVHVRFSLQDAQKSFILLGATTEEIEEQLIFQLGKQRSIQPLLLITGTLSNPTQIVVYFDGIKYKVFSVLRGIEILFAIIHLFNLKYPLQSVSVWMFIQTYFFKIKTKYDVNNTAVKYLIERLEK